MKRTVNSAIRQVVRHAIYQKENSIDFKKERTISVMRLLKREIKRQNTIAEGTRQLEKEIQKVIPSVQKIDFWAGTNYIMRAWRENSPEGAITKQNEPVLITYKNDNLDILSIKSDPENEQIFLRDNRTFIKNIMEQGIKRGYHQSATINTVSTDFQITLWSDRFNIHFSSNLLDYLDKHMFLAYPYDQQEKIYGKTIKTRMGNFSLQTNIGGIYRLLKKELDIQYFRDEERTSTLRFLRNLQVYQSNVPSFLQIDSSEKVPPQKCKK